MFSQFRFSQFGLAALILVCASRSGWAGRSVYTFPLESQTVSNSSEGNGKKSLQTIATVQMVNLSNKVQNLTLTLLDEAVISRVYVRNVTGITNWNVVSPGQSSTWINHTTEPARGPRVLTARLLPEESKSLSFLTQCELAPNGVTCYYENFVSTCRPNGFGYQDPAPGTTSCPVTTIPNQECSTGIAYRSRLKIEVAEDHGAVLANFRVVAAVCNGSDTMQEKINYPVNGGRPF